MDIAAEYSRGRDGRRRARRDGQSNGYACVVRTGDCVRADRGASAMGVMSTSTEGVARRLVDVGPFMADRAPSCHAPDEPPAARSLVCAIAAPSSCAGPRSTARRDGPPRPVRGERSIRPTANSTASCWWRHRSAIGLSLLAWTRIGRSHRADAGRSPRARAAGRPRRRRSAPGLADVTTLTTTGSRPAHRPGDGIRGDDARLSDRGSGPGRHVHRRVRRPLADHQRASASRTSLTDDYVDRDRSSCCSLRPGWPIVVRVATEAETRATRLSASNRERVDVAGDVQPDRRPVRWLAAGRGVIQASSTTSPASSRSPSSRCICRSAPTQLTMVGVAGYADPFHVIDVGVGIIGRAAATQADPVRPRRPRRSRLSRGPGRRPERGRGPGRPQRRAARRRQLRGHARTADRPGPGRARRDGRPRAVGGPPLGQPGRRAARAAARHRAGPGGQSRRSSRTWTGRGSWPRSWTPSPNCSSADVVALVSRQPDGTYQLEAGKGFPEEAIGSTACRMTGSSLCDRVAPAIIGLQEVAAWPAEYLAGRPGGTTPHAAMALPIEVGSEIAAVLLITRIGADQTFSELERGIADLLTAQIAIALQNADLHARVAVGHERRVVAEPARSPRRVGQPALAAALEQALRPVRLDEREHADVRGAAVPLARHVVEQLAEVLLVVGRLARVAGGPHPGRIRRAPRPRCRSRRRAPWRPSRRRRRAP